MSGYRGTKQLSRGSWDRGQPYLPTSMQKSPRMVPGGASTGSVAPMSARETRTTSSPCHTCGQTRWRGVGAGAGLARHPPSSTHHGHHRP